MNKNTVLALVAAFAVVTASLGYAQTATTTTTIRDQDGVITAVNYQTTTPWFTVKNSKGEESRVYIESDKSYGWTRVQKWDGNFVTGKTIRYQYEDRDNNRYARNVYITD